MSQFFVDPRNIGEEQIEITDREDYRHLVKVLRAREGDQIIVCDGAGTLYDTRIETIEQERVVLAVDNARPSEAELPLAVDLYQGIPKHGKMDLIVQKTVEMGIGTIYPVYMERTVPAEKKDYGKRVSRFQKIAEGAAKQSRRGRIPTVAQAMDFTEMVKRLSTYELVLFLYEGEEDQSMRRVLEVRELPKDIALVVGPEGGFSEEEAGVLSNLTNGSVVTLGPRILRTETAALAALAQTSYRFEL